MACLKGVVPWWGLPWNWLLGERSCERCPEITATDILRFSDVWKPVREPVLCSRAGEMWDIHG